MEAATGVVEAATEVVEAATEVVDADTEVVDATTDSEATEVVTGVEATEGAMVLVPDTPA